jgi:hypothetical protein
MPAAGWLINKFGSLSIVIGSTLGFALALPLIAESNTVLTLSVALLFYGAMAGSMANTDFFYRHDDSHSFVLST